MLKSEKYFTLTLRLPHPERDWEHNLQLYYKRDKASEIMFGDANYHREEIARKIVDGDED
jgi:hypothetical protein